MKSFILPGFYEQQSVNSFLLGFYNNHPDYFNDDLKIECFYGSPQYCLWNGGRIFEAYNYHRAFKKDIETIFEFYSDYNIPIRLTFTNSLIDAEMCSDLYCNFICSVANEHNAQVLVNSIILENYLQIAYPNLQFCSSTTKCLNDINKAKQELNNPNYIQICLDYNLNKNKVFLENLTENEKLKTEFLCNAICPPNCESRPYHYFLNDKSIINVYSNYNILCPIKGNTLSKSTCNYKNNISPEEIENYYEPNGFIHYKLEGRTLSPIELLSNYARYLIKPEYQLYFMSCYNL